MKKIITAIVTGVLAIAGATAASGAPRTVDDCTRVASADLALCHKVQRQHAYGSYYADGQNWTVPGGKTLVHTLTHRGWSKARMHRGLIDMAAEYRQYVTAVPVNLDKLPGPDCWYEVGLHDADGKPGGVKQTTIEIICPS